MRRLLPCIIVAAAGCGGGIDGDWNIQMTGTCAGQLHIDGPDSQLGGLWACGGAAGPVTGSRSGGTVILTLDAAVLRYPLKVNASIDGSSMNGTVAAQNYPSHVFVGNR